jgi:5-methylcytosine-specific restriction endonuclease McrA
MDLISFKDLKTEFKDSIWIPYNRYLQTAEWQKRREEIFERDDYRCQQCQKIWNYRLIEFDVFDKEVKYKVKDRWISDKEYSDWRELMANEPITFLHVHHKLYYLNRLPWNYMDNELISLCSECHENLHKNNKIKVLDENNNAIKVEYCDRCNGTGHLPQFNHIQAGICFKCDGERFKIRLIDKNKI